MMDNVINRIKNSDIGKVEENVSLKKHTTYRVGGIARLIVYPKNVTRLVKLMKILKGSNVPYKVLGKGSNLLFSSKKYEGVLIKLDEFDNVEFFGRNKVRVGAGFSLIRLSMMAAKRGLTGLEFASGIPGSVGGAVFMNAGAYKSDMGYIVETVKVLTPDLKVIRLENKEMNFHYRTSFLLTHPGYICLEAVLKLNKGKREAIEAVISDRRKRRVSSQPLEYPSAGSVFRNPEGGYAGEMIEELGFKGLVKGGAMISNKHANFIVNFKNASSEDIKYLIDLCQKKVYEKYNVVLKCEQEFVNWE